MASKTTMPLLSIVLPIYNAEPYIEHCLDRLVDQSLQDFEILCINDGSQDDSLSILTRYAKRYPTRIVVQSQNNGGASIARNTGLEMCRGKYIAFVDADDWVSPSFFGRLVDLAEKNNLDMAIGNGIYHFEGRQIDYPIYTQDDQFELMTGREAMRRRLRKKMFFHYPVLQIYRRECIEHGGLRFIPYRLHEDVVWTTRAFLNSAKVAYDGEPGYYYRQYPRQISKSIHERDNFLYKQIQSAAKNAADIAELMKIVRDDPDLYSLIACQMVDGASSIFHMLRRVASPSMKRQICDQLRKDKIFSLLWNNSQELKQKRRIVKAWMWTWLT